MQSGYNPTTPPPGSVVSYNDNGTVKTLTDPNNNLTHYYYDGFDRLWQTHYPAPSKGAGSSSATDYEQLVYDAASNVVEHDLRGYAGDATRKIVYGYDHLERVTSKDLPDAEPDVSYAYDNLGRLTGATQSGNAQGFTYDALGRVKTQTEPKGVMSAEYGDCPSSGLLSASPPRGSPDNLFHP